MTTNNYTQEQNELFHSFETVCEFLEEHSDLVCDRIIDECMDFYEEITNVDLTKYMDGVYSIEQMIGLYEDECKTSLFETIDDYVNETINNFKENLVEGYEDSLIEEAAQLKNSIDKWNETIDFLVEDGCTYFIDEKIEARDKEVERLNTISKYITVKNGISRVSIEK